MRRFDHFLEKYWAILPIASAILLVLCFYPFDIWFLCPIVLAPLYYFAGMPAAFSKKKVFFGAGLTGAIFAFSLAYMSVIQFHWIPQAYIFEYIVRASFLPIALASGCISGLCLLAYRLVRKEGTFLKNIFFGTALYVAAEIFLSFCFKGYYFGTLAYSVHSIPFLVGLASLGGVFFVSFIVGLVNIAIAEFFLCPRALLRKNAIKAGSVVLAIAAVGILNHIYMGHASSRVQDENAATSSISVAILESSDRSDTAFGYVDATGYHFDELSSLLSYASAYDPNLIIYPFSPVNGSIYAGQVTASFNKDILVTSASTLGSWISARTGSSTTVMTWNTMYRNDSFLNEFDFWKDGSIVSTYDKRKLFPFMDYTPAFAQSGGLYTTPIDTTPGAAHQDTRVDGISMGMLLCSEINNQELARQDAISAPIVVSAGSEAMFVDDAVSRFNLVSTQFRAAENGTPFIRANRLGPSGVSDAQGNVLAPEKAIDAGTTGKVLLYDIKIGPHARTVFSYVGNWLIEGIILLSLLVPFAM